MSDSFGARLRQERERRQIALAFIAAETKISSALLEALERDDLTHWPTGVYRRGFIRDYARVVGLDGDATVREFLERYPDPIEDVTPPPPGGEDGNTRPPTRLRYLVGSAVDALRRLQVGPDRSPVEDKGAHSPSRDEGATLVAAAVPDPPAAPAPASIPEANLLRLAELCTDLGRVVEPSELDQLLARASEILGADGIIIWVFEPRTGRLIPVFVHGYSDAERVKLPTVHPDADNATAASYRSARARSVPGSDQANGAVVVPLMSPTGCRGVLAVEMPHGREQGDSVQALATIIAAQLATLVGTASVADVVNI